MPAVRRVRIQGEPLMEGTLAKRGRPPGSRNKGSRPKSVEVVQELKGQARFAQ